MGGGGSKEAVKQAEEAEKNENAAVGRPNPRGVLVDSARTHWRDNSHTHSRSLYAHEDKKNETENESGGLEGKQHKTTLKRRKKMLSVEDDAVDMLGPKMSQKTKRTGHMLGRDRNAEENSERDAADDVLSLLGVETSPRTRMPAVVRRRFNDEDLADEVHNLINSMSSEYTQGSNRPPLQDTDWFKKRQAREIRQSPTVMIAGKGMADTELEDLEAELDLLDHRATAANSSLSSLGNLTQDEVEQQERVKMGQCDTPSKVPYKLMQDQENASFKTMSTGPRARHTSLRAIP